MEVRILDPYVPGGYEDGLDQELDTIGIILDNPVICGNCLKEMKQVDKQIFSCPDCGAIFRLKG